jgi:hypothetical protein
VSARKQVRLEFFTARLEFFAMQFEFFAVRVSFVAPQVSFVAQRIRFFALRATVDASRVGAQRLPVAQFVSPTQVFAVWRDRCAAPTTANLLTVT